MPRGLGPVASWPSTLPVAPSTMATLLVASFETKTWSFDGGGEWNVQLLSAAIAASPLILSNFDPTSRG